MFVSVLSWPTVRPLHILGLGCLTAPGHLRRRHRRSRRHGSVDTTWLRPLKPKHRSSRPAPMITSTAAAGEASSPDVAHLHRAHIAGPAGSVDEFIIVIRVGDGDLGFVLRDVVTLGPHPGPTGPRPAGHLLQVLGERCRGRGHEAPVFSVVPRGPWLQPPGRGRPRAASCVRP